MNITLTTICRVTNPATGMILAHRRVKSWVGVAFPGGHVEENESEFEAIRREVLEETGLAITNIEATGLIHWIEPEGARTLIFAFCADMAGGNLIEKCDEGENFWVSPEEYITLKLSPCFREQLPAFERGAFHEVFYEASEEDYRIPRVYGNDFNRK